MKKTILILSILILSCSKNDSKIDTVTANVVTLPTILVSSTIQDNDPTNPFTYTYEGNKLVSIYYGSKLYVKYTYTNNLITQIIFNRFEPSPVLDHTCNYTYDVNNRLVKASISYYNSGTLFQFTYNSNNTVSFSKRTANEFEIINTLGMMFLTNNEITKIEEYTSPTVTQTTNFTYDSKENPFKNVLGFSNLLYNGFEVKGFNHNVLTQNFTITNSSYFYNISNTYNYNASNFPVTCSQNYTNVNNVTTNNIKNYFY